MSGKPRLHAGELCFELWCLLSRCADAGRARMAQEHEEACVISATSAAVPCNN